MKYSIIYILTLVFKDCFIYELINSFRIIICFIILISISINLIIFDHLFIKPLLGHSMSDHPKKMKFETAPPQILIKLYTLPLCDYNRRPVVFFSFF